MSNNLKYLAALSTFPPFGSKSLLKIKQAFADLAEVWRADLKTLTQSGLEEKTAQDFIGARLMIDPEKEWQKIEKEKLQVISIDDEQYPPLLKEIYDPPALLYYRGLLDKNLDNFPLAVVGSRRLSLYGRQAIEEIVAELARQGLTIVSGLALGADSAAHVAALKQGGRTLAVLGSGLDWPHIYPAENRRLAEQIIENKGLIISEFPIGTLPLRFHFPIRNRLISGLSLGTFIIEAAEDSGSLITAKIALEQNREVFSLPGNIFSPLSTGPNNLLKMGAHVVTEVTDILDVLHLEKAEQFIENKKILPDTAEEAAILKILSREPKHVDAIMKESSLNPPVVSSTLTLMEMKGKVRNLGAMMYVTTR